MLNGVCANFKPMPHYSTFVLVITPCYTKKWPVVSLHMVFCCSAADLFDTTQSKDSEGVACAGGRRKHCVDFDFLFVFF